MTDKDRSWFESHFSDILQGQSSLVMQTAVLSERLDSIGPRLKEVEGTMKAVVSDISEIKSREKQTRWLLGALTAFGMFILGLIEVVRNAIGVRK